MKKFTFILIVFAAFLQTSLFAAVPHLLNYQGRLTDKDGKPVADGTYSVTFRIWDAETAGNMLWEETQSVTMQKSIFAVLLGSVTNLGLAFDKPYFLEIKFGTEVMSPRQRITSAGYAISSEKSENAINSDKIDNFHANASPTANQLMPLDASAKVSASVIPNTLGAWVDKSSSYGAQKALTDGFVIVEFTSSDGGGYQFNALGYTDSNADPVTCRGKATFQYTPESPRTNYHGFMMPVRKNDYWKVVTSSSGAGSTSLHVYWISIGN